MCEAQRCAMIGAVPTAMVCSDAAVGAHELEGGGEPQAAHGGSSEPVAGAGMELLGKVAVVHGSARAAALYHAALFCGASAADALPGGSQQVFAAALDFHQ